MSRISTSKYLFPGMVVPTVRAFPSHALVVVFGLSCWRVVVARGRRFVVVVAAEPEN
jgi:hypothetical protein